MVLLVQPGIGSNGTAVSNANGSTQNQWDAVILSGTSTTLTYDNTHTIHGNATAIKDHLAATASTSACQWKAAITATANAYARLYIYMTAIPTAQTRILNMASGSNVTAAAAQITVGGLLRITNSSGTTVATTVAAIPLNQWVRIEFEITGISGSTGNVAARMYSGANLETATPDTNGSISGSGVAVTGTVNDIRFGQAGLVTETSGWDLWLSDMAFSDTAQPGFLLKTLDATSAMTVTTSATLTRTAILDAAPALTVVTSATLTRTAIVDATSALTLTTTAALVRTAMLDGSPVALTLTTTATITRAVLLDAATTLSLTTSATLARTAVLDATAPLSLVTAATLARTAMVDASVLLALATSASLTVLHDVVTVDVFEVAGPYSNGITANGPGGNTLAASGPTASQLVVTGPEGPA